MEALPILTAAVSYYDVAYGLDQAPVPPAAVYYLAIPVFEAIITEVPLPRRLLFLCIYILYYNYKICILLAAVYCSAIAVFEAIITEVACHFYLFIFFKIKTQPPPRCPPFLLLFFFLFNIIHFV